MKNRFAILILFLIILPYGGCLRCGASDFARINPGTKNAAMGNTGVSFSDLESVCINPAGLFFIERGGAGFTHISHFEEIVLNNAIIAVPADFGVFGFSFLSMDIPEFQGYDERGFQTKKIKSSGNVFSASFSFSGKKRRLQDSGFSFGLSGKYITERLDLKENASNGFDAGIYFRTALIDREFSVGVSALNLLNSGAIPEVFCGFSYSPALFGKPLNFAASVSVPDNKSFAANSLGVGAEYWLIDILALRCGLNIKSGSRQVNETRFGIALKMYRFMLEYSVINLVEFAPSHRFSFKTFFGSEKNSDLPVEESFEKAFELYNEERYAEAMLEFNNVIKKDPLNAEALKMLKESYEHIK